MRIAMIHTPFPSRGGGERQILRLAIELQKKGHYVEIFTNGVNKDSFPEFFSKVKINVVPHPLAGKLPEAWTPQMMPRITHVQQGGEQTPYLMKWIRRMRERVLRQQYVSTFPAMLELGRRIPKKFDIINTHNFPTEWAGFIAKNRLKVPLVWMCSEPPYWFFIPEQRTGLLNRTNWPLFELVDKTTVNYMDEIMVLSYVCQDLVRQTYKRSSTVVRTGVDAEPLHKASGESVRKKYQIENEFVILQAGGLNPIKRQSVTIEALHRLSKKHDRVKLILDGSGRKEYLIKLSEKLGVRDKVLFLCSKNDSELAQVYAACDVFVYPSVQSMWGMGLTEAMAANKPVVVSKLVGVSEIIQDGVNGLVTDYPDAESIAKKIEVLIGNPELCRQLGQNAYKYVLNNLSWQKYAESVEGVFRQTLSRFQGNVK